jgi:hypothetical protein
MLNLRITCHFPSAPKIDPDQIVAQLGARYDPIGIIRANEFPTVRSQQPLDDVE